MIIYMSGNKDRGNEYRKGKKKMEIERGGGRRKGIIEEREKFECRFEEMEKGNVMTEMRKGVAKIFLIFEGELYTFVMIRVI